MNIKNSLFKYYERNKDDEVKMGKLFELFHEFVNTEVYETNIDLYNDFIDEFEDYIDYLEEEEIIGAITHLKKKDGTTGNKWSMEEVNAVVHQFNIKERLGENFCEKLFYFAMNYAYAVHCSSNKTLSSYVETAIEEYLDHNIPIKHKIRMMNERF